jgi:hypothetical protein
MARDRLSTAARLFGHAYKAGITRSTASRDVTVLRSCILPIALIARFGSKDVQLLRS